MNRHRTPPTPPECPAHHPEIACGVITGTGLIYAAMAALALAGIAEWIFS